LHGKWKFYHKNGKDIKRKLSEWRKLVFHRKFFTKTEKLHQIENLIMENKTENGSLPTKKKKE
jgi:hypothetical protein